MTREELRTFCDMDDFYRFQKRLNRATEADALDILSYLLAEGMEKSGETLPKALQVADVASVQAG